jgi:hypothetical protein
MKTQTKAFVDGVEIFSKEGKRKKGKRADLWEAAAAIDKTGRFGLVHQTEHGAKAWAVWSYTPGDNAMHRTGVIPKDAETLKLERGY